MKLKLFYSSLFVLLLLSNGQSQTVLTITDPTAGNSGSADVILSQAETLANSGQNVVVNMNASALCDVSNIFLSLTAGSITIQKDPSSGSAQGFGLSVYTVVYGLIIYGDESADITLNDITFKNYEHPLSNFGINHFTADHILFKDCGSLAEFENGNLQFTTNHVLIQNCIFDNTTSNNTGAPAIYRQNQNDNKPGKTFKVLNNEFKTSINIRISTNAAIDELIIDIKNNFSGLLNSWSSEIGNYNSNSAGAASHELNDYGFDLSFENNSDVASLWLIAPMNDWKIENNIFDAKNSDLGSYISISHYNLSSLRPYKTSFINSAPPYCTNQTFLNATNIFKYHNSYPATNKFYWSIVAQGNNSPGCGLTEFMNLELPGTAFINGYGNVSIRKCKIFSSSAVNRPISSSSPIVATLNSLAVSGGNVSFGYTYTGITPSNGNDLYVDVYKSNTNGDLLDYIGEQFIPVNSINGSGTINLLIPTGVSLNSSDRVAITLTGLHPPSSTNIVAMGTSKAFYPPLSPYCKGVTIQLPEGTFCYNNMVNMSATACSYPLAVYNWSFGDGLTATGPNVSHSYPNPGSYNIQLTVVQAGTADITSTRNIVIGNCVIAGCKDCIGSFQPSPGDYILSLWVKEDVVPQPQTYNNAKVKISFLGVIGGSSPVIIGTDGSKNKIIEGWQRIEEVFTVPPTATNFKLELVNNSSTKDAYYDDIRVYPIDGQMKTYVYDPVTLRLSATLDENNYATFYEYDEEGKLIRIKKETEKGIVTIQESREGYKKK